MSNYSFWQLIDEHFVEIPIIQRDYAQGRDTPKSSEIRKSFVESIVNATKENDANLHLNFVYGKVRGQLDPKKVEENKKAIEAMLKSVRGYSQSLELDFKYEWGDNNSTQNLTSFLPLDGQQRLTTLFLYHWYILRRRTKDQDGNSKLLHFSYQIRPSTKQFCEELVKSNIDISIEAYVSDIIKDSNWFFKYWLKDPSVSGMLHMLDEIHKQCSTLTEEELERIWINLTENKSINFELLDLDEFELTDELYVKMNARGKALTSFENFKSSLMEFIEEKGFSIEVPNWEHELDTSWADLFWDNKDDENMLIDEEYYLYFRNVMQLQFALIHNLSVDDKDNIDNFQLLAPRRKKKNNNLAFYEEYQILPLNQLDELGVLTQDNLNNLFNILSYLSYYHKHNSEIYHRIRGSFKSFITGEISYPDKVQFFALIQYLVVTKDSASVNQIDEFLRVIQNLVKNTVIDSVQIVKSILDGLNQDAKHFSTFNTSIQNEISFSGFRSDQVYEEKVKILLIQKDIEWKDLIDDAEKHEYFQGQIGFLLHLSRVYEYFQDNKNLNFSVDENKYFKELFIAYLEQSNSLFTANGLDHSQNNLVERALLTYEGNYFRSYGSGKYFPMDKDRDYSWYRFLREFNSNDEEYQKIWDTLELLLIDLVSGKSLDEISTRVVSDWKRSFVEYPETFNIRKKDHMLLNKDGNKYLLSKSDRRSKYAELETFYLYKSEFENCTNECHSISSTHYNYGSSKNGEPCLHFDGFVVDNIELQLGVIHYGYKDLPWEIYIVATDDEIKSLQKELSSILETKHNFELLEYEKNYESSVYLLFFKGNTKDISNKIKSICEDLTKTVSKEKPFE